DRVLKLTAYLLFAYPRRIKISENDEGLCSCIHAFTGMWYKIDELPNLEGNLINGFDNDPYDNYYPISDTFTENEEKLGMIDYHEMVDDVDPHTSCSDKLFTAKIAKLYRDGFVDDMNINSRYVIDFFYNLLKIGVKIDNINESGIIKTGERLNSNTKFNECFQLKLIEIAKITIKEEFDFELYGIHPIYNIETMSPYWEIPNLLTALYFALFYTRPDYEVYRKCSNPNCNRLFKVKTTNSRKQYHDTACQNAAAQMRHRKVKK
ncbi:CGNR zinc finger domain-containing protein, partial [Anaerosporobacter sp.]|uniref:CGNR zinc finger domain-containing protein n=1 Tax=Anaerosporobacter sp. TaxID=1872529 RepID=UPI00286F7ADC